MAQLLYPDKKMKHIDIHVFEDIRTDEILTRVRLAAVETTKIVTPVEWNELITHIEQNLMTEERIMKEYECGRQVGWQNERERCVKAILDIAAEYFIKNEDDKARHYRELAKKIKENK